MIERKGVAGYSDDVARVLALFRDLQRPHVGVNLRHLTDAKAAGRGHQEQGRRATSAIKLVDYVTNPAEKGCRARTAVHHVHRRLSGERAGQHDPADHDDATYLT